MKFTDQCKCCHIRAFHLYDDWCLKCICEEYVFEKKVE